MVNLFNVTENFDKSSREHEKKIVIDLTIDRLIRFIAYYVIGTLALASAIFLIADPVVSCESLLVLNNEAQALFIDSFCWFSTREANSLCDNDDLTFNISQLLTSHEQIRTLYNWFPYVLILQVLTFTLPTIYWKYHIGSSLTGQLKYMQFFLENIQELLSEIERGIFNSMKSYDTTSSVFNGYELYDESQKKNQNTRDFKRRESLPYVWLTGTLLDRHLFSVFCYENFASFKHLPHILSIFQASGFIGLPEEYESEKKVYSLKECILNQWCHPQNFSNNLLARLYLGRQLITAAVALLYMAFLIVWYLVDLESVSAFSKQSFNCFLPEWEQCIPCAINRKNEVILFLWMDIALLCVVFVFSLYQWHLTKNSSNLAVGHFFENLMKTTNVAFDAAGRKTNNRKGNQVDPRKMGSLVLKINNDEWKSKKVDITNKQIALTSLIVLSCLMSYSLQNFVLRINFTHTYCKYLIKFVLNIIVQTCIE